MSAPRAGLYVHLPWCVRKCPYCDFNSYEADGELAEDRYVDVLLRDLDGELSAAGAVTLSSIFIGGGTPSLFGGRAIERLLGGIMARVRSHASLEITLEANPGSAEAGRFRDYRQAGVNRLSIGVQSFDDAKLSALGRVHNGADAQHAIASARTAGFDNLNLDLMFGLPGARRGDACNDLRQAIEFEPAHISWYQLTLEAGTAFARKPPQLPTHDEICDEYDSGLAMLAEAGFEQYEISAHARAARRARHNLNYWRFGDYLGIGAGAHGKITRAGSIVRRTKIRHPERYMKAVLAGLETATQEHVQGARCVTEYMLNALRLKNGFTLTELTRLTGFAHDAPLVAEPLGEAFARGWLEQDGDRVRPSGAGFRFLNDLQMLFVGEQFD